MGEQETKAPAESTDTAEDKPKTPAEMSPREVRRAMNLPMGYVATHAGVSPPTVRMFEVRPEELANDAKRAALEAFYADLRVKLAKKLADDAAAAAAAVKAPT